MKARVYITLKRGILDPQGQAVQHALGSLGHQGVQQVRIGKFIELDLTSTDQASAQAELKSMCEQLLANTVIEDYRFEVLE